ncbi:nucleotide exchange factor GrpE [Anaplasma platys]|nr:nucleotide exchange factor GrpE [Anaplasma platys]
MPEEEHVKQKSASDAPESSCEGSDGAAKAAAESRARDAGKFAAGVRKAHNRISADLAELNKLKVEIETLRNQLRLAVADSKNLERLRDKEISDARIFSISGFVRDLIPSFDNLEASLKNLSSEDAVHAGVKMTWDSLMGVLTSHGVVRMFPKGEPFDTRYHTAVTQAVDNELPEGSIIEVVQTGYILNGKVIRPASVVVSKKES